MQEVYVLQISSNFDGILETEVGVYKNQKSAQDRMNEIVQEDLSTLRSRYGEEHIHINPEDEVEDEEVAVYMSNTSYESYEVGRGVGTTLAITINKCEVQEG